MSPAKTAAERAAFEAWAKKEGIGSGHWNAGRIIAIAAWQARAALAAAPVQAVPEAELEALRKDAERYRRLRDGQNWPAVFGGHDEPEPLRGAHLDAAIDAKLALHNVANEAGQTAAPLLATPTNPPRRLTSPRLACWAAGS